MAKDAVRDGRTRNRFFVDNTVIRDYGKDIGVYGIAVYSALCMNADLQDQTCYPSHATIAAEIGCGVTKVKETLGVLKSYGLIDWEQRRDDRGGQTSNLYVLLDPPSRVAATNNTHINNPHITLPPSGGELGSSNGNGHQPPIGGGVVVHDLDEVAFHLEHTGRRKSDLEAQCPHCGAGHTQETNVCPDCGAHVVWLNSPAWKRLHGDPKRYLRELQGEDLKAVGPLEVEFCRTFNYRTEFANRTQQREFRRLARKYPADYIRELMAWANGKGFQALKGAVENPDNLTRWQNKQYEQTQPGADNDQPSGWELQALQAMERK